jgi:hypothetical protein
MPSRHRSEPVPMIGAVCPISSDPEGAAVVGGPAPSDPSPGGLIPRPITGLAALQVEARLGRTARPTVGYPSR